MILTQSPAQWTALQQLPIQERILPLPDEVRDFVHQVNAASGVDAVPRAAALDTALGADLRADLRQAIGGMPASVLGLVDPLLLGVCLGHGIGSSGVTDIVVDADGRILGCVVLVDVDCFDGHTASSWATHKENLPFLANGNVSLDVTIAEPEQDTRAGALQFLLLHEFGHVLSADASFLPRWWEAVPDEAFAFLDLSWETGPLQRFVPRPSHDFPLRDRVDFYGKNKLDNNTILTAYAGLEGSAFASLYGATNPYDDFAECFATWVHGQMLGRPYRVRVDFDGVPQAFLDSFWDSPRSQPKRAFMQRLFEAADAYTQAAAA